MTNEPSITQEAVAEMLAEKVRQAIRKGATERQAIEVVRQLWLDHLSLTGTGREIHYRTINLGNGSDEEQEEGFFEVASVGDTDYTGKTAFTTTTGTTLFLFPDEIIDDLFEDNAS